MVPGIVPDVLLFLAVLWVFDGVAVSPVLLSGAVRRLARTWPTGALVPNWIAAVTAFAVVHLLWLALPVALHGGTLERNVMGWLAGMTLLNVVLWWIAVALLLPMLGLWSPKEESEYDGRIALTLGVLGYVVATGVFAFVAVIVIIAVGFPG
ncbi:MAG: hypothetical protein ACOCSD_04060 [Halolamina sp.]